LPGVSESVCACQYIRLHDLAHSRRLLEQGAVRRFGERVEALHRCIQLVVVGLGQRVGDRVVVRAMKEVDGDLDRVTFLVRSVESCVVHDRLPENILPRHMLIFSVSVYSRFSKDRSSRPVNTDLMSWVVPMPRLCIAESRTERYESGRGTELVTGASSRVRTIFALPSSVNRWSM